MIIDVFDFFLKISIFSSFIFFTTKADKPCIPRKYNYDSIVCVCNASYCDEISKIKPLENDNFILYTTTLSGERFKKTTGKLLKNKISDVNDRRHTILKINKNVTYQKIIGFGGSFTDSTGINIMRLSKKARTNLIKSYFGKNGIEYNLARVPMGGTDFSTHFYAYNMIPENDTKLSNFSLTFEDYKLKIPAIKKASQIATSELYLVGSTWQPPFWMANDREIFTTHLKREYFQTWADYHLKFLEEYSKENISFWGITTGNEPSVSFVPVVGLTNLLGWLPRDHAYWIVNHLGPTLRNSKYANITILTLDDQRIFIPYWLQMMTRVDGLMDYIDGIAMHWYSDFVTPNNLVLETRQLFPNKFILSTEASIDFRFTGDDRSQDILVHLGDWSRARRYCRNIIENLNTWYSGWIDWNMVLNLKGGPTFVDNFLEAAIVINNNDTDEFLKQPFFYALGHFSKFIPRDSIKIDVNENRKEVYQTAFLRKDGGITIVLFNDNDEEKVVMIEESNKGKIIITLPENSINTLIYW